MKNLTLRTTAPRLSVNFILATLLILAGFATPAAAQGQGQEDALRARVVEALNKGDLARVEKLVAEASVKKNNLQPGPVGPVSGSLSFEEIRACGFYPQETRLECVIDIKQNSGYGGPIETFGSTEYVSFCVDWNNDGLFQNTELVGQGNVVMHDGAGKTNYAVYRDINIPGGFRTRTTGPSTATTTTNAPILNAQATLSWVLPPTGCNFSPIWGNVFKFRIRLDPIR
ncbi:MAG TPA: hypothetical protein VF527_17640 [Pyrinomonadaceae bacterium]|jgi:hypothetical protein